jgi:hypothetical protein
MADLQIIWDLEDDPDGNYWHIVVEGHGVTREEVEEVLRNDDADVAASRSTGNPMAFAWTSTGKYITVVYEEVLEDPRLLYPRTAYPVKPPKRRRR